MEFILFLAIIVIGFIVFSTKSRLGVLEDELRLLRRQIEHGAKADMQAQDVAQKDLEASQTVTPAPIEEPIENGPPEGNSVQIEADALRAKLAALKTKAETTISNDIEPETKQDEGGLVFKPQKQKRSLEEEIGARWAVWVGGLTLALGAIFLLRYAVEAGVFSPTMRVGLTVLMGLTSLGAGEFLRRKDNSFFKDRLKIDNVEQTAYIPGILTGVGIFALYGATYAAYGLYNLIPAMAAFIGMAVVSFAALGLSLIQGPKIAGLGLVGSMVTPLLVSSDLSNYPMLFTYIVIVALSSIVLSRVKKWSWLAIAALFGTLFWMWMTSFKGASLNSAFWPWIIFSTVIFAVALWVSHEHNRKVISTPELLKIEGDVSFIGLPPLFWFGLWGLIFVQCDITFDFGLHHHIAASFAVATLIITGFWRQHLSWIIVIGGGIATILAHLFAFQVQNSTSLWVIITFLSAALFTGATAIKSYQELDINLSKTWAVFSVGIPTLMFLNSTVIKNYPAENTALLLAALMVVYMVIAFVARRSDGDNTDIIIPISPATIYCIGFAATYCLAFAHGFNGWPFSLAMMMGIVISVIAYQFLKEPILKLIALGFAGLTAAHVLAVQLPIGTVVGPRPIFNSLWLYFITPAVICAGAAWYWIKSAKPDIWTDLLKALSLSFVALFAIFQVRHLMNDGNLLANQFSFDEIAMQVVVGLCFTLGGLFLGKSSSTGKFDIFSTLAVGISMLTLMLFVFGVCLIYNPIFNPDSLVKGGIIFNNLMLAFLIPSLILGAIGWFARDKRDEIYLRLCVGLSLGSFLLYITTMIRRGYSGARISIFRDWPGDVELYAISAAWLILGVGLLTLGMKMSRRDIRLASAIVIVLTVLKAFFVDMASLEGALRAISFVVLGVVLIVIGRVYQRLLFSDKPTSVTRSA